MVAFTDGTLELRLVFYRPGATTRFDRVTPAPFSLDIGTTENLVVNMNGGDDTFTGSNGLAPLIQLTVDGGAGVNTLNLDALGRAVTITATGIFTSGLSAITYSSLTTIAISNATAITIVGTAGDDTFTLSRGASGTQVARAGGPTINIARGTDANLRMSNGLWVDGHQLVGFRLGVPVGVPVPPGRAFGVGTPVRFGVFVRVRIRFGPAQPVPMP